LHSSVATLLLQDRLRQDNDEEGAAISALTEREREVLTLVAEGLMNRDIGEMLGISPKTVARHRENIMRKLGLHSRTELVKYAIRIGLIDLDSE
jgi:DNA-binding NarL/FixJ family response regulator